MEKYPYEIDPKEDPQKVNTIFTPTFSPQDDEILKRKIAIPYTTTQPTFCQ